MSNVKIEITLSPKEVKEAIEDYVHRNHGSRYGDLHPQSREVTLLDSNGALVIIKISDC